MKNANRPAYPDPHRVNDPREIEDTGLTKRERFAMAAMQGMLAGDIEQQFCRSSMYLAVEYADALLKELEATE